MKMKCDFKHIFEVTEATSKKDIEDTLGSTFMMNSSHRNYSNEFIKVKCKSGQENTKLNFKFFLFI